MSNFFLFQLSNTFQGPVSVYKQFEGSVLSLKRHMDVSLQIVYAKRLLKARMTSFPKPIINQNHVHYIGKRDLLNLK